MTSLTRTLLFTAPLAFALACPGGEEPPVDELTEWLGAAPHFVAQGRINGEDLDLRLEAAAADDITVLFCEREYVAPDDGTGAPDLANATNTEFKIIAPFTIGGEARRVELEYKKHSFQTDAPGTNVTIIPRDDTQDPPADQMWLEWEWHLASDDSDLFESAAQEGTFQLGQFAGTPGADGVVIPEGEGAVGGFVEASWSADESLKVSASAPCSVNNIEIQ